MRNVKFMSAAVSCESCRAASADYCRTLTLKISLSPAQLLTSDDDDGCEDEDC